MEKYGGKNSTIIRKARKRDSIRIRLEFFVHERAMKIRISDKQTSRASVRE